MLLTVPVKAYAKMLKVHESFKEPEDVRNGLINKRLNMRWPKETEQKPLVSKGKKKAHASVVQTSNGSSSL